MKRIASAIGVLIVSILAGLPAGAQQTLAKQTATAGPISATITLMEYTNRKNALLLYVDWENAPGTDYPMGCLSPTQDIRYQLRDARGNTIPVSEQTLRSPGIQSVPIASHVNTLHPLTCAQRQASDAEVAVRRLFPQVRSGTYTFLVTLAPRGLRQQASFAPIPVTF